jgi:chaperonin GroES
MDNHNENGFSGIKPLGERVLIKEEKTAEKTASGIILPDSVKDETNTKRGVVVEVGNLEKISLNKGDDVLFEWGTQIRYENKEYYLVTSENILAVIK